MLKPFDFSSYDRGARVTRKQGLALSSTCGKAKFAGEDMLITHGQPIMDLDGRIKDLP